MDANALKIQQALQAVAKLRVARQQETGLSAACHAVKSLQSSRLETTYADLLQTPGYARAARFFLQELYGTRDYTQRDQQFERIASTIARLFPQSVVDTAAALAQTHALTEQLDQIMARHWLTVTDEKTTWAGAEGDPASPAAAARYVACWRLTGERAARQQQLDNVLQLGTALGKLTRQRGLRLLLKMMRTPAAASGLSALQQFLESGFDAFASLRSAENFLAIIRQRETHWIDTLFNADVVVCEAQLRDFSPLIPPH